MPGREYPARPIVGVGGVLFIDGRVLLAKRRSAPMAGGWSLPGGALEVGETLAEGLAREMKEETGLDVEAGHVVEVIDRITRDQEGRVQYHYVLADFICRVKGGELQADSDARDARFVPLRELSSYSIAPITLEVIHLADQMWKALRFAPSSLPPGDISYG